MRITHTTVALNISDPNQLVDGPAWNADHAVEGTPWISPEDYGAVGDGSTDDAGAIQRALDALSHGGVLQFGPKTYRIASGSHPHRLTLSNSHVCLRGVTGTVLLSTEAASSSVAMFGPVPTRASYTDQTTYSLTSTAKGSTSCRFATASQASAVAVDDVCWIADGTVAGVSNGEPNLITAVNTSTGVCTLQYPTAKAYTSAPTIAKVTGQTLRDIRLEDLTMESTIVGANLSQIVDLTLTNVTFLGDPNGGPLQTSGFNRHVRWDRVRQDVPNPSVGDGLCQITSAVDVALTHCTFTSAGSSLLDVSEGAAQVQIVDSTFLGPGQLLFSDCQDVLFAGNVVRSGTTGIGLSANNGGTTTIGLQLLNNDLAWTGTTTYGIVIGGQDFVLSGNRIRSAVGNGQYALAITGGTVVRGVVSGNRITGTNGAATGGIILAAIEHAVVITGNYLEGVGLVGIVVNDDGAMTTAGPIITNNLIRGWTVNGIQIALAAHETHGVVEHNSISDASTPIAGWP